MDQETLKEELRLLVVEIAEIDTLEENTSFRELGIDSMMGVEIVAAIERKYNIKIEDTEVEQINTLKSSCELVQRKIEKGRSVPNSSDDHHLGRAAQ